MALSCPKCAAAIPARAVNLDRLVAKCEACDEVFRFEPPRKRRAATTRLPRPAEVELHGELSPAPDPAYRDAPRRPRGALTIALRWFRITALGTLAFSILWCGFLGIFYRSALRDHAPLVVFLVPLIHVAVGAGVLYGSLATLLNRTRIVVDEHTLRVSHGPLPWWPTPAVERAQIRALSVVSRARSSKGGAPLSYTLVADVDGRAVELVRGISGHDIASYMAQVLEDHLAIGDRAS